MGVKHVGHENTARAGPVTMASFDIRVWTGSSSDWLIAVSPAQSRHLVDLNRIIFFNSNYFVTFVCFFCYYEKYVLISCTKIKSQKVF